MKIQEYKKDINGVVWGYCGIRVCHAYARFYNFGDNALAYGVKNVFQKYFSPYTRYMNSDVHSTIYNRRKINEINSVADLFLVGGGGLIHSKDKYWMFNMANIDIQRVRCPMVFYGLGYNNFSTYELNTKIKKNIQKIAKKSLAFSVRNDESCERLLKEGMIFDEVPDPGFFVDGNHPRPEIAGRYVMLQIAYDAPKDRQINEKTFVNEIVAICNNLIERGYTVVLAPHCWTDIDISRLIVDTLNNQHVIIWDWFSIIREENTTIGLGYYKYADFVIAMRGHAQICPIGMGVPVISIINHPKHLGILRNLNLMDLYVSVNDNEVSTKIISMIDIVEKNRNKIKAKYETLMDKLTDQTRNWVIKVQKRYSDWLYGKNSLSETNKKRLCSFILPNINNKDT